MSKGIHQIQMGTRELGYDPGPLDGLWGPRTLAAMQAVIAARGQPKTSDDLPWMVRAKKVMGMHERADNAALKAFLKSDGATLGDPAERPWCGDFVETCIALTLANEEFPGDLGDNRYWARNWLLFGRETAPTYGAVLVFSRDGGGHVGFCAGADSTSFAVLGGNQSDRVSVARIARDRLLGARWPMTFPTRPIHLPSATGALSTNEA
jgi:uncharacterized protein (TIGR02594 family)